MCLFLAAEDRFKRHGASKFHDAEQMAGWRARDQSRHPYSFLVKVLEAVCISPKERPLSPCMRLLHPTPLDRKVQKGVD